MSYPRDRLLWDRMYRLWRLSCAKAAAIKRAVEQARNERLRNAVQLPLL